MNRPFAGFLACFATVAAACGTTVIDATGSSGSSTPTSTTTSTGVSSSGFGGGIQPAGGSFASSTSTNVSSGGFGGGIQPAGGSFASSTSSGVGAGLPVTTTSTGVSSSGFGGGIQPAGGSFASSTGSGFGGSPAVACPARPPTRSASCASFPDGYRCTYGDSVNPDCRASWNCNGGVWSEAPTQCTTTPPSQCPATEPSSNESCGDQTVECVYGADLCFCGCGGGILCVAPYEWSCTTPPAAPCPSVAPNSGTACSTFGASCTYGDPCSDGVVAQCEDGFWTWEEIACGGALNPGAGG